MRSASAAVSEVVGAAGSYVGWLLLLVTGVLALTLQTFWEGLPGGLRPLLFASGTLLTTVGGIGLGRVSGLGEARRLVRPLAGPAFRRTFRLYDGIGQQLRLIRSKRRYVTEWNRPTLEAIDSVLELLELQAREQLRTSNDAVEEWSVLLPKEVRELRSAAEDLDVD